MSDTQIPLDRATTSVREAREATQRWLRHLSRPAAEEPTALVVSELVTNSVVHACDPIALHLREESDHVRVGVSDGSTVACNDEPAGPDGTSGRGMRIVERIASRWGSEVSDVGKLTWADIPAAGS